MSTVRRRVVVALAAAAVAAPALLVLGRWPRWWLWIASEQTPMTWLQSVTLVLAGAAALLTGVVLGVAGVPARERWVWGALGAGLGALALDERFALHERLRDGYLAPRGISVPVLPWVAPGDFVVMGIAACGLLLLPRVWAATAPDPAARRALAVGVTLALVAVGLDSVDPATWTVAQERLQQTGEEVVELASGLALLACTVLRLLGAIAEVARRAPVDGARADGADVDGTPPDGTAPDGTAPDHTAPDRTAPDDVGPPAPAAQAAR